MENMQIQRGKLYENRTWRYLFPCLRAHGEDLINQLSSFFKLAVGVRDFNREEENHCIYILIDTNLPFTSTIEIKNYKERFNSFLNWIRNKEYFVADYIYEKDMHMIVIKLPEQHLGSYVHFINGQYSRMYNLKEIREYFKHITIPNKEVEIKKNKKITESRNILFKDKKYVPEFVNIVNTRFKTNAKTNDFIDAELDFPPSRKEEIFNYTEVGEAI